MLIKDFIIGFVIGISCTITTYPMRPPLSFLCFFYGWVSLSAIPAISQSQPSSREPTYKVLVYEDGVPINPERGASVLSKLVKLRVVLTDESLEKYPYLKPAVIVKNTYEYLIRNGRRIMIYPGGASLYFSLLNAQAGDQILIESADLRVETRDGMTRKLTRKMVCVLPIYEEK